MIARSCLASIALATLVACSSSASPPAPTDARFGAPQVNSPRDVRQIGDPCEALSPASLAGVGLAPSGRPKTLQTGDRACDWESADGVRYLTLIVVPGRDVLVDTYRTRQFLVFEATEIGGAPATREQSFAGSTTCTVTVGTAEGQGLVTDLTSGDPNSACEQAERAAELAVAALPPLPAK